MTAAPEVHIAPPRWFARLAVAAAVLWAVVATAASAGALSQGRISSALVSLLGGVGLAVLSFDVSRRSVISHGDVLEVRQWFRVVHLDRHEIDEFAPARGSLVRWDIVAVHDDGHQLRLWVTRMLVAGRPTRLRWIQELEAWRTWIGPPTASA